MTAASQTPPVHRVLIVEDSATLRETLVAVFESDPSFRVVATTSSGKQATRLVQQLKPDLITLDLMLPDVEGIEVIDNIMKHTPSRILVVSSRTADGSSPLSMRSLQSGALAVFHKTGLATEHRDRFLSLAHSLCEAPAPKLPPASITQKIQPLGAPRAPSRQHITAQNIQIPKFITPPALPPRIVAIGASTGGPTALERLFRKIPSTFPLPIVVAQHMSAGFAHDLVAWMRTVTKLRVEVAEADTRLKSGTIYFAPDAAHLLVREGDVIKILPTRSDELSCPSVDRLLKSVAEAYGSASLGVILTGMGDDGCEGLLEMRKRGARTVAQDEATSLIFGMPKMAIANQAARAVLSIDDIAAYIIDRAGK